jgi:hypothetical protein
MGTVEILNFLLSGVGAAFLTIWKNKQEDTRAEREFYLQTISKQAEATKDAREYEGVPITEQSRFIKKKKTWMLFGKDFGYDFESNDSGTYKASTGFHMTRRIIALLSVISLIVLPIILPVFYDASVTFGYIENSWTLLPWVSEVPVVKWITVGDATRNVVITPLMSNVLISVISSFMGNQITKR